MVRVNRLLTVLVLVVLLLSACQPIQRTPLATTPPEPGDVIPRFVRTPCLYPTRPEDNVECGFLLAPEVRSQPESRVIRLHVLIFKSTSDHPAPDPLVLLNGGPGSPGGPMVSGILRSDVGRVWRAERDVIYIDQRGANFSVPGLHCPALGITAEDVAGLLYAAQDARYLAALQDCYGVLVEKGINLSAYNVLNSAADINDLRTVLGYDQINLYGFSYGSLLAMVVMRDYPAGIRSVILDAVWPPGVNLQCTKPACLQHALDALFAGCAADQACAAAYPDLEATFYAVADRLRAEPVQVVQAFAGKGYTVTVDDLKFLNHVVYSLQMDAANLLPAEIDAAAAGDYREVVHTWLYHATAQGTYLRKGWESPTLGLYYSVMCSYLNSCSSCPTGQNTLSDGEHAAVYHPTLVDYAGRAFNPCTFWQVAPMNQDALLRPVRSAIPTLMLVGEFDPGLPSNLSRSAAALLSHSYYYELPVGHVSIFSPCGLSLTAAFLANPQAAPDSQCVAEMSTRWVLPR
ncbi:MAG: alpha/beta hydrolase [Caldilineaceae bacterium]|nr:alpha/beta hydrolase [Caldilineaceae bacterium]